MEVILKAVTLRNADSSVHVVVDLSNGVMLATAS
jgi:hypothetical protein